MRKLSILIAVFMLSVAPIMADKQSEKILDEMSSAIDSFDSYEVSFEIESGGHSVANGVYVVDNDIYKLIIADQEIYGDGESRFTIDNAHREVVMERIDSSIPMVIANPAQAFSALNKSFESKIVEIDDGVNISVMLTPRKANDLIDNTLIEIDPKTKLPLSARYTSGGEIVIVKILDFAPSKKKLTPLDDMALPNGYDTIDIR